MYSEKMTTDKRPETVVYTFHRGDMFYPLELESDESALANARCNEGTLKVVNEVTGKVVFSV